MRNRIRIDDRKRTLLEPLLAGPIRIPLFHPFPRHMYLSRQFPHLKASEVDRWLAVDQAGLVVCERPTRAACGKLGEYCEAHQLDQSRYDAAAVKKLWEAALTEVRLTGAGRAVAEGRYGKPTAPSHVFALDILDSGSGFPSVGQIVYAEYLCFEILSSDGDLSRYRGFRAVLRPDVGRAACHPCRVRL